MKFTGERMIPEYNKNNEIYLEHMARYIFASQFVRKKVVLDIACGSGYGCDLLQREGAERVIGVDISNQAIEYCEKNYPNENIEYLVGDLENIPVKDHSIDVVISFETIEHVSQEKQAMFLKEIKRVLKNDGILVISTPNTKTYVSGTDFHKKELSFEEFSQLLGRVFSTVKFLYQDNVESSFIFDESTMSGDDFVSGKKRKFFSSKLNRLSASQSLYFVAVCSFAPIQIEGNVSIFNLKPRLEKDLLNQKIAGLKRRIEEKDNEMKIITNGDKRAQAFIQEINEKKDQILTKDKKINLLRNIIDNKEREISFMRSSKFWKLRNVFMKYKRRVFSVVDANRSHNRDFLSSIRKTGINEVTREIINGKTVKFCIIIPTFNNSDFTIRCFNSIQKNSSEFIIVWIDNGSDRSEIEKVRNYVERNRIPYIPIFNEKNVGFVKAVNQGLRKALELEFRYIVIQNNDTEVFEGWLENMEAVAKSNPKIGLVGPITSPCESWQSIKNISSYVPMLNDLPRYDCNPQTYAEHIRNRYKGEKIESKIQLAFFSTLIKADVVREIGLLSEEFNMGFGDDDDYCMRAQEAGWKLYLAIDTFVFHNHRTTFKNIYSDWEIKKMMRDNSKTLFRKHGRLNGHKRKFIDYFLNDYFRKENTVIFDSAQKEEIESIKSLMKNKADSFYLRFNNFITKEKILAIFNKIIDSEYDIFLVGNNLIPDEDRKIYKLTNHIDTWAGIIGKMKNCDMLCIKKDKSLLVTFISHTSDYSGGAEKSLVEMVDGLIRKGILIHLVIPAHGNIEKELNNRPVSYDVMPFPWWVKKENLSWEYIFNEIEKSAKNIYREVVVVDSDIIFTNTSASNIGSIVAKKIPVPHIWHVREFGVKEHGLDLILGEGEKANYIYNNSAKIIFNSESLKERFNRFIPGDKSVVVYNAVITKKDQSQSEKRGSSYFVKKNAFRIFYPGSIQRGKNQKDAILAVISLLKEGYDIEFIIAGKFHHKDYYSEISRLIENSNYGESIRVINYMDNIDEAFNETDIVVSSSINEAFGRTSVEAMLHGKPVVGAASGGTCEIIKEGINGLLFEPNNWKHCAEKIKYFIENRNKISEFGLNGFKYVTETYTEENYSGKIFTILREVNNSYAKKNIKFSTIWLEKYFRKKEKMENKYPQNIAVLMKKIRDGKSLIGRAFDVFSNKGVRTFVMYAFKYLKYGRKYFE